MQGAVRRAVGIGIAAMAASAFGQSPPSFEFDSAAAVSEWTALDDVAQPAKAGDAMRSTILGGDPSL